MIIKQFTATIDMSAYKDIESMSFVRLAMMCNFDPFVQLKGSKERQEAYDQITEWDNFPTDFHYGYVERLPRDIKEKQVAVYMIPSNMGLATAHEWLIIRFHEDDWEDRLLALLEDETIEHTFKK